MGIFHNLTGWHAIILFAVVLLFFGASKLPGLAKSVGQSVKILKSEARESPTLDADTSIPETGSSSNTRTDVSPQPPTAVHAATIPSESAALTDLR